MSNVLINVITESGPSHCDCLKDPSMDEIDRRIKKLHQWEDLSGFVFIYGTSGKTLQVSAPMSKAKRDSVCKLVTGYYG